MPSSLEILGHTGVTRMHVVRHGALHQAEARARINRVRLPAVWRAEACQATSWLKGSDHEAKHAKH